MIDSARSSRDLQRSAIEATWPAELRSCLRTNSGDHRVYGIWRQTLEAGLFDHLDQFLDPTQAAVDVGALLGQYSFTLAASCTRCLCVEPLEQYRFVASTLPPNCVWRTVAAGSSRGRGVMSSPVSSDGGVEFGLSKLLADDEPSEPTSRRQPTEILPLDEIVRESLGDDPIGFVKIDVEGRELDVLAGAQRILTRDRPNFLIEADDVAAVKQRMGEYDYRGLFFFRRRLFDLEQFEPAIHCAQEHQWSPERSESFDPALVMSDLYFLPAAASSRRP